MLPDGYTSILEAPLDEYLVPDQGDMPSNTDFRTLAWAHPPLTAAHDAVAQVVPVPVVPYFRPLQLGSRGRDVIGAKRAIWKANGLPVPKNATQVFGPIAVKQLRLFQKTHGVAQDGVLGPGTLRKLSRFFDQYAFLLYTGFPPNSTAEQRIRAGIVAYAIWGYNNRVPIHYAMFRPMTFMSNLDELPVSEDCSTLVTKAYKSGKAPDPNRFSYNGYGNTWELRKHGVQVSLAAAKPGDLLHYDNPQHVGVYVGHGRCISHGSEMGPLLLQADYRPIAQVRSYLASA